MPSKRKYCPCLEYFVPSFCSEHIFQAELYKALETSILVEMLIEP